MKTREIILKSALELFLKNGYDKTAMNDIAAKAGISKPAIYHYFKSKQELAEQVVEFFHERVTAWSREKTSKLSTFKEHLRFFITSIPVFHRIENVILDCEPHENFSMGFNDLISALSRENSNIKSRIEEIFLNTRQSLGKLLITAQKDNIIRQDVNPQTIALMLHAIAEGMSVIGSFTSEDQLQQLSLELFIEIDKLLSNEKGEK